DVHEAIIRKVTVFSDALSVDFIEFLHSALPGTKYCIEEIKKVLHEGAKEFSTEKQAMAADVADLIEKEFA
ncbi:MAG: lipoate protein ligase C-terminal domain-containing protein, partial [Sphaerochaetaceae bacterium]